VQEIDIHSPKTNLKSAGFTPQERASFGSKLLGECGLTDTFRAQHPAARAYTYFSFRTNGRAKNQGWRLDYFLASPALAARVHDSYVITDAPGFSDHVPIGLVLKPPAAA